jgi:prepilin-type N-terminal cleavage/methylation domain-containing protein
MNTTKSRKGFTLIELVVTIVLLGALAAIASVAYGEFLVDARGEIAAVESAQDDRIVSAQNLLDEEGEYQVAAPTPVDGMTLQATIAAEAPGSSMLYISATEPYSISISLVDGHPSTGYLMGTSTDPLGPGTVVAIERSNGSIVYATVSSVSNSWEAWGVYADVFVTDPAAIDGARDAVSFSFYE